MTLDWGWPQAIVLLVALQRLVELAIANRNTRRLLEKGGREVGAKHYPFIVALHATWLLALFLLTPGDTTIDLGLLGAFVLLQLARIWVMASLGAFWTTRIVTLPDTPLVRRGPYRFLRHPNYIIVALEIPLLPLAFGNIFLAIFFFIINVLLIGIRVKTEDQALAPRRSMG